MRDQIGVIGRSSKWSFSKDGSKGGILGRFSSVSARVRRTPAVPIRGPSVRRGFRPCPPASGPNFSESATDYPIFPLSALIFRPSVGVRTPFRGVFRSLQRIISGSRCTLRSTYDLGFFAACCAAGRCCTLCSTYDLVFSQHVARLVVAVLYAVLTT